MNTRTVELTRVVDLTFGNRKDPVVAALRVKARALDADKRAPAAHRRQFVHRMLRAVLFAGRKRAGN